MNEAFSEDLVPKLPIKNTFIVKKIVIVNEMVDPVFSGARFDLWNNVILNENQFDATKDLFPCRFVEIVHLYSVNSAS